MIHVNRITISPETSLSDSIKVLHEGGYRIALVIDNNGKLQGTLTDGDVRRALMSHYSMDDPVDRVMNIKPITININDDSSDAFMLMKSKSLLHIPVIDDNKVLIGLETIQDLIAKKKFDNPVFLMAGGFGKRLKPLTNNIPKPLLDIGGKPILETILIQFIESGFYNFYISTHYKAEMIRNHFGDGSKWGVNITYIHEIKPLGTAGSLGLLPQNLPDLPILMMNGDILTRVDFSSLLDFHNKHNGIATMCVREYDFQVPYGVVESEKSLIKNIVEKPVHNFFVNAGIYVLNTEILENIYGTTYLDMPNLLSQNIANGKKIHMFPIYEYWLDIGQKEQYLLANKDFDRNNK